MDFTVISAACSTLILSLINIFMTQRGKERLIHNDFSYYKQSRTRSGFRWGCTKNRWHRCKAYIHLSDDMQIVRIKLEYPYVDDAGELRTFKTELREDETEAIKDKTESKEYKSELKETIAKVVSHQSLVTTKIVTMLNKIAVTMQIPPMILEEPAGEQNKEGEDADEYNMLSKYSFPISKLDDLQEVNKELANGIQFNIMENHYNTLMGTDGQGRGEILGRKMAEHMITKALMTQMSWTGVSRTPGCEKKFPFQTLDNIFRLFYKVLSKADTRWTSEKNERLFSGSLLKHAKMRAYAEKKLNQKKKTDRTPKKNI